MFWKRLSLTKKIFLALALTSTTIVILMALMVGLSMRAGFARYVVQAQIERFDELEQYLAETAKPENPRWPNLEASPRTWHEVLRRTIRPVVPPRHLIADRLGAVANSIPNLEEAPRPAGPRRHERTRRRPPSQQSLIMRVSLFDSDGNLITGPPRNAAQFVKRPIMPIDGAADAKPLGWIGLSPPRGTQHQADAVFIERQLWSIGFASMTALALSALAAFFLACQFLAPVRALAQGAQTLAAGNYTSRMSHDRHDELGRLIDHHNALAQSLEAAEHAERQWISDTSHELQTPLAVLRAEIEALQDNVRQPTTAVLARLHDSVMRLSRLVDDLNTLSRARESSFSMAFAEADIVEIAAETVDCARALIEQDGLMLDVTTPPKPLFVECDRYRLGQLLDNLLENARRYTDAPGRICLSATEDISSVFILIEDTAPCPPPDAIGRLFDRFYRVEASRSRSHGGSGLGLAICQVIVQAHGGRLEAKASDLGGLSMLATLPKRRLESAKEKSDDVKTV